MGIFIRTNGPQMTLVLENVTKAVGGQTYIHNTDLTFARGGFNVLLGTTLSGKTTLMQLMAGLEPPTGGEIYFDGQKVTRQPVQKRNVSMVYQQFINYPNFSVFENIASPLRVARRPENEIRERVGQLAELLRISAYLDRRPSELSGGQQQRCAIARALAKDSDLVLLDEPLANLDFKLREELRDELPRMFAARDCVVVYATTEPTEALLLGGHTAALYEGRVVDFGETGRIYRRPGNLLSARVFSEPPINLAPVQKQGDVFTIAPGVAWPLPSHLAGLADGQYQLGLRAHHVAPLRVSQRDVPIGGTILVAELSGSESIIHFDAFERNWVSLSHGVHPFATGDQATLYADMERCFYFSEQGEFVGAGSAAQGGA